MDLSYWEKKSFFTDIDVTIAGSGIVGLSAAYYLKKKNPSLKILVIERGALPSGASSRNAGFCCFGSPSELLYDLSLNGEDKVFSLVEKRWNGLRNLRAMLGDSGMDFQQHGGYELFTEKNNDLYEKCIEKINYLNKCLEKIVGKNVFEINDSRIKEFGLKNVQHIIENKFEGQIDAGKMISRLIKLAHENDIQILNGLTISSFNDNEKNVEINTNSGFKIFTKKLLVATNGFAKMLLPGLSVNPARAQVLITKPIEGLKFKGVFHFDEGYFYFRNIDSRILFGGGRNLDFESEFTMEMNITEKIQNRLEELLRTTIIPDNKFEIDMRWSGIMGIGNEKSPIVKQLSEKIFCAVRMGGMGIAIGTLIGKEAAEMIEQKS